MHQAASVSWPMLLTVKGLSTCFYVVHAWAIGVHQASREDPAPSGNLCGPAVEPSVSHHLFVYCAGEVLECIKLQAQHLHQRDTLMALAFDNVGSLPMDKIDKMRYSHQVRAQDRRCS